MEADEPQAVVFQLQDVPAGLESTDDATVDSLEQAPVIANKVDIVEV